MRIDMDTCEEILITITRNKTRSLLTAFGVFWGIFMLVALIGGGQGLEDMMKKNFEGFATNSGFLVSQRTGEAYKGFRKGRWWNLESTDIERLRSQVKEVEIITPSVARWGSKAVYEDKKYDCSVKGLYPDYLHIESQEMAYGRFINEVDIKSKVPNPTIQTSMLIPVNRLSTIENMASAFRHITACLSSGEI